MNGRRYRSRSSQFIFLPRLSLSALAHSTFGPESRLCAIDGFIDCERQREIEISASVEIVGERTFVSARVLCMIGRRTVASLRGRLLVPSTDAPNCAASIGRPSEPRKRRQNHMSASKHSRPICEISLSEGRIDLPIKSRTHQFAYSGYFSFAGSKGITICCLPEYSRNCLSVTLEKAH
jgi:hypothetical protein